MSVNSIPRWDVSVVAAKRSAPVRVDVADTAHVYMSIGEAERFAEALASAIDDARALRDRKETV